jgi:hypothetical protein
MIKNSILAALLLFFMASAVLAQKAWLDPDPINPADSVTIYVDIKATDCQRLLDHPGPLYLWTWEPAGPAHAGGNGSWTASNSLNEMKNEGDNIWSYKMVPTEFYDVEPADIYNIGFSFLVKAFDGTGGGGGGCDEDKTEDLHIDVDAPSTGPRKVYSFPDRFDGDSMLISDKDVFTFFYNNKLEEKATILNLTEAYIYARCVGDDGVDYRVSNLSAICSGIYAEKLKMTPNGNGLFSISFIPERFFSEGSKPVPPGVRITRLRLQILRCPLNNSDDAVDGEFIFELTDCD